MSVSVSKILGGVIAVFAFILALGWIAEGNDFFLFKVFAPKYEQVRRDTFEQSKAYNQGTIQNLRDAQRDYITAAADRRTGLGSVIIQQYADYPDDSLPKDLRAFMICLRQHQAETFDCSPGQ
jgi:hypothetical protein